MEVGLIDLGVSGRIAHREFAFIAVAEGFLACFYANINKKSTINKTKYI